METEDHIVVYDLSFPPLDFMDIFGFPLARHATSGIPVGPIMSGFRPLMMLNVVELPFECEPTKRVVIMPDQLMVQDATESVEGVEWMTMLMARHWLDYRSARDEEDLTRDVLLVTSFDNQNTPGMYMNNADVLAETSHAHMLHDGISGIFAAANRKQAELESMASLRIQKIGNRKWIGYMRTMQPPFHSVESVQQELGAGFVTLLDYDREVLTEFEEIQAEVIGPLPPDVKRKYVAFRRIYADIVDTVLPDPFDLSAMFPPLV